MIGKRASRMGAGRTQQRWFRSHRGDLGDLPSALARKFGQAWEEDLFVLCGRRHLHQVHQAQWLMRLCKRVLTTNDQ